MILDLICSRYPGTRPSQFYGQLDDYEAFQFDAAMALRGQIEDRDYDSQVLHVVLEGLRGVMKSNGAEVDRLTAPKRTVIEHHEDEVYEVSDLLEYFGGKGVVME